MQLQLHAAVKAGSAPFARVWISIFRSDADWSRRERDPGSETQRAGSHLRARSNGYQYCTVVLQLNSFLFGDALLIYDDYEYYCYYYYENYRYYYREEQGSSLPSSRNRWSLESAAAVGRRGGGRRRRAVVRRHSGGIIISTYGNRRRRRRIRFLRGQ